MAKARGRRGVLLCVERWTIIIFWLVGIFCLARTRQRKQKRPHRTTSKNGNGTYGVALPGRTDGSARGGGGEGEEVRRTTADDDTRRDASGGEWVATLQLAALWVDSHRLPPPLGTSATIPSEMAQTGREEGHERGVDSQIGDPPPRECARWRHCVVLDGGINSLVSTTTTKTTTRHTTTSK